MITVRQVATKKEQKEFLDFPLRLYKDCAQFVPPLYMDEKKIFSKDFIYNDTCEHVYFLAYKDGAVVGRISGILQRAANEKWGQKRVRFTRFDSLNDPEIAKALFDKLEEWARERGMEEVVGPLGFSDMEREGLLIEGFDELATFEEQYNYDYYQQLIEDLGYEKEVDWLESKISPSEVYDEKMHRMSAKLIERYKLHQNKATSVKEFLDKYADTFFDMVDASYDKIYGSVPFTENMKKMMIDTFKMIVKLKYVGIFFDENETPVAFGLCFPSIAMAVQKSGGKLTPACLVRLLRAINHPKVLDLALIGVNPEWNNKGVGILVAAGLDDLLRNNPIEYAETNLNLEDNHAILNTWKRFTAVQHKKRRSYVKKISR